MVGNCRQHFMRFFKENSEQFGVDFFSTRIDHARGRLGRRGRFDDRCCGERRSNGFRGRKHFKLRFKLRQAVGVARADFRNGFGRGF